MIILRSWASHAPRPLIGQHGSTAQQPLPTRGEASADRKTMDQRILDQASDYAFSRLKEARGDIAQLPEALRTLVMVYSAQSAIDDGGLEYFYLSDYPGQPPYGELVEAYRRIGADRAAECIQRSAQLFGLQEPHKNRAARQAFLADKGSHGAHELKRLGDDICGDMSVWESLGDYVVDHGAEFGFGPSVG
jgi:hypothetical protein